MSIPVPEDFTIYRSADEKLKSLLKDNGVLSNVEQMRDKSKRQKDSALSDKVQFSVREQDQWIVYSARALICWCWARTALSITLRVQKDRSVYSADPAELKDTVLNYIGEVQADEIVALKGKSEVNPPSSISLSKSDPQPPPENEEIASSKLATTSLTRGKEPKAPFLFSKAHLTRALFPAVFYPQTEIAQTYAPDPLKKVIRQGLVVISGQTGSLKSQLLRSLVQSYLSSFDRVAWGKSGRLPHILTLEDPIETPLMERGAFDENMLCADKRCFDFTPREIGKDVISLKEGLLHALRQTPAVVIVGEVRNPEEWAALLRFAATGHLCFTTTHAGSLVETMRKIIEATRAITPDLRSSLVEKILSVVHLQKFPLDECGIPELDSMILPALWRNAHGSANFFVSDGLGAILPRRHATDPNRPAASCRGRADFAEILLTLKDPPGRVREFVNRLALKSDLQGI